LHREDILHRDRRDPCGSILIERKREHWTIKLSESAASWRRGFEPKKDHDWWDGKGEHTSCFQE
jgi:hypothetical protein